jgi:hypothetical protein
LDSLQWCWSSQAQKAADITDLYQEELVYFLCNRELTKMCIPALDERHLFQVEWISFCFCRRVTKLNPSFPFLKLMSNALSSSLS